MHQHGAIDSHRIPPHLGDERQGLSLKRVQRGPLAGMEKPPAQRPNALGADGIASPIPPGLRPSLWGRSDTEGAWGTHGTAGRGKRTGRVSDARNGTAMRQSRASDAQG